MGCPREITRRTGKLESFDPTPGQSQARVRFSGVLQNLPTNARGVLQADDSIALCTNGDRYDKMLPGTIIVCDMMLNAEGKDPVPGPWAPKTKSCKAT